VGQAQGVASGRHSLREEGQFLHGRALPRRHSRLAQELTGPKRLLERDTHIALKGESKCGKSWLRKKNIPNSIVVQCGLTKTVDDIYRDILGQLGQKIITEQSSDRTLGGSAEATQELGTSIFAKLTGKQSVKGEHKSTTKYTLVGQDGTNLRYVADAILASQKRLIIEDFHYMSSQERKKFALHLKALWEYKVYVIIIGIWTENNLLVYLNSDLTFRIEEMSIHWSRDDLLDVISKGSLALNIKFSTRICGRLVEDAYGTVGVLQKLALATLDEHKIFRWQKNTSEVSDESKYDSAAMSYADQLNALYQTFAQRVARGIRQRKNSTSIYAHMLTVVMNATAEELTKGLHTDNIFKIANSREKRIQKPNLRQIMGKIDALQIDEDGKGLILTYDQNKDEVYVIDKQLFFYRQYCTVQWPWERMIQEKEIKEDAYEGDDSL